MEDRDGSFACSLAAVGPTQKIDYNTPTSRLIQGSDIWNRTDGHNAARVDVRVTPIIMLLDMLEVSRILERGVVPVKVLHPLVNVWIPITDGPSIALEVAVVDRIEAHDCRVEPDVCLREPVTDEEGRLGGMLCGKHGFDAVERGE